jgi:hypothetical protein
MKKLACFSVLFGFLLFNSIALASVNISVRAETFSSSDNITLLLSTRPRDWIEIGTALGYQVGVVKTGNVLNVDVVGTDNYLISYPGIETNEVSLGRLAPGIYEVKLRYRNTLDGTNPGAILPLVRATANFTVESGAPIVTQVPALTSSAFILLSLLVLGVGLFATRRQ